MGDKIEYAGIRGYRTPKNNGRVYFIYNNYISIYNDKNSLMGKNKIIMEIDEKIEENKQTNFVAVSFDKDKIDYIIDELKKLKSDKDDVD